MNKLISEFKDNKLKIYNYHKLILENYSQIKEINQELIIIDKYQIIGKDLKINLLNQFIIEIYGDIEEIKFK